MTANWQIPGGMAGSQRRPARFRSGAICLSNSSHFPLRLYSNCSKAGGVATRVWTGCRQSRSRRDRERLRIRSARYASLEAAPPGCPPAAKMTSGASPANSVAYLRGSSALRASPSVLHLEIVHDRPARLQPLKKCRDANTCRSDRPRLRLRGHDPSHPARLLGAHGQWPCGRRRRTAESGDEFAPSHTTLWETAPLGTWSPLSLAFWRRAASASFRSHELAAASLRVGATHSMSSGLREDDERVVILSPHANFGCTGCCASSLARSVLGHSSSRPSNPDATRTTALMVKPVM